MPHLRKRLPTLRHLLMKPSLRTGRIANFSSSMPPLIGGLRRPIGFHVQRRHLCAGGNGHPGRSHHRHPLGSSGQITAQVTENIYDSPTGRAKLIPQGARLIGIYDSQVAFGQSRVLLVWTRLIMPNGRSIVLERQYGAEPSVIQASRMRSTIIGANCLRQRSCRQSSVSGQSWGPVGYRKQYGHSSGPTSWSRRIR